MKIVINPSYGGFHPNYKIMMRYAELKGIKLYPAHHIPLVRKGKDLKPYNGEPILSGWWEESNIVYFTIPIPDEGIWTEELSKSFFNFHDLERNDPAFVQAVEEAGKESNLTVVEIPDDVEWEIEEYDGAEWVSEKHRTWS